MLGPSATAIGTLASLGSSVTLGSVSQSSSVTGGAASSGLGVGSLGAASSLASLLQDTSPVSTS